jgi:ABC-type dipeptide/oligopeptide/nickel transport system ATPase component
VTEPILAVSDLSTEFLFPDGRRRRVLHNVSLTVGQNEVLGVVGEAGAGKSVLVRSILGLLPESAVLASGCVSFEGADLNTLSRSELRKLRGARIAPILPNAKRQLNPVVSVGDMVMAVIRAHRKDDSTSAQSESVRLIESVGIQDPERCLAAYPHELSGGMAQRVCIALALVHDPTLIVADEPTHGLDVTVQRQVLDLMARLVKQHHAAQLIVTRDLGIVAHYCSRIAVMQEGRIVETGPTVEVFESPTSSYTRALIEAARIGMEPGTSEGE